MAMHQEHKWPLDKYARHCPSSAETLPDTAPPDTAPPDTAPPDTVPPDTVPGGEMQNGWMVYCGRCLTLSVLQSGQLIISNKEHILESLALFTSSLWMKSIKKGDSILFLHKVKNVTRKFRIKFSSQRNRTSDELSQEGATILRTYFPVRELDEAREAPGSKNRAEVSKRKQTLDTVSTDQMYKKLVSDKLDWPIAYQSANIPTEEIPMLVKLCLADPHFPTFVQQVDDELQKQTKDCQ